MPMSEATVKIKVGDRVEHTASSGNGPVHALDQALRCALEKFYPSLGEVHLVDYKVRVINGACRHCESGARADYLERRSDAVGYGWRFGEYRRRKLASARRFS